MYAVKNGSAYWLLNEASEKFNDVLKSELRRIETGHRQMVGKSLDEIFWPLFDDATACVPP